MDEEQKIAEAKIEAKLEEAKVEAKLEEAVVEAKLEEAKIEAKLAEAKIEAKNGSVFAKRFTHCKSRLCKIETRTWVAAAILILIAVSYGYVFLTKKSAEKEKETVKITVEKFIKDNLIQPGTELVIKDITKEGALYKLAITVGSGENAQDAPVYATADGKLFPSAPLDMTKDPKAEGKTAQAPEKAEAENKTDVPTVDLFVMSYCPYGLQMERGVLPAVEALGNKIKFNLKFVDYTLHGPKELTENVNQYCISKTQPAKLDAYLKCFWKDSKGAAAACMKTVGINVATVTTCVAATNKQFSPTEKAVGLDAVENKQFGVQGSPTLVINGTTVASGRDSASVLKAICSGFTTAPKECQAALSATPPGAGFDDEIAKSAGSATAPAASCATN